MSKMRRSIFHQFFSCLVLIVFCGENLDLLIAAAGAPRTRSAPHHGKCCCSQCYDSQNSCLCEKNPSAKATANSVAVGDVVYKAYNCSPQATGGILLSPEMKCLLYPLSDLAPRFPNENVWPGDKSFFLTDLFAPSVFKPPQA
jgi:hypothetical protein